jgi:hypothetical protein
MSSETALNNTNKSTVAPTGESSLDVKQSDKSIDQLDQPTHKVALSLSTLSDSIEIQFQDIQYNVVLPVMKPTPGNPNPPKTKTILDGCTGTFRPGRMTAVMGASGKY